MYQKGYYGLEHGVLKAHLPPLSSRAKVRGEAVAWPPKMVKG